MIIRKVPLRTAFVIVALAVSIPLAIGTSCSPPPPTATLSPGAGDTFSVTLFSNGQEVDRFELNDGQSNIAVGENATGTSEYGFVAQNVAGFNQVGMFFESEADLPSGPVAPSDARTLVHLASGGANQVLFCNCPTCPSHLPGNPFCQSSADGTIDLQLSGGRLVGSFDITIGSLRATGEINVPRDFGQTGDLGPFDDFPLP